MKSTLRTVALVAVAVLSVPSASASEILRRLPSDAVGFVVVRNLAQSNAKIEEVIKIFQKSAPTPIPAPLPLIKAATGLGPGIDEQGDALLALLPGDDGISDLKPVLLVSVADYEAFATAIKGDVSGEICRVTIAREEVLAARLGDFAVLMNVEHREPLEALLAAEEQDLPDIAPLRDWIEKTDVAFVLTPAGVDMLAAAGRDSLVEQTAALERHMPAESFRELQQSMAFYEQAAGFLGAEIEAAAIGLAIDDASNVKLLTQAALTQDGRLAAFSGRVESPAAALAGYADKPYVMAAGGHVPAGLFDAVAKLNRELLEANPQSHGFENLSDDDWQAYEDSWRAYTKGITSASVTAYLGDEDDPLVSNLVGLLEVDEAKAYLQSYRESIEAWNKLLAKTSLDIKLEYVLTDTEIAGRKGLLTTIDLGKAAEDPNVPMIKFMVDALLGGDGQLKITLAAVDDDTVLFGIDDVEDLEEAVKSVADAESEAGLARSSSAQITTSLLEPKPSWVGLLSPRGAVAWCGRLYNNLLAQLGPGNIAFPEFPESPPVGVTLTLSDGKIGGEMTWPKETLEGLAVFITKLQDGF